MDPLFRDGSQDVSSLFHHVPIRREADGLVKGRISPTGYLVRIATRTISDSENGSSSRESEFEVSSSEKKFHTLPNNLVSKSKTEILPISNGSGTIVWRHQEESIKPSSDDTKHDPQKKSWTITIQKSPQKTTVTPKPVIRNGEVRVIPVGYSTVPLRGDRREEEYYLRRMFAILGPFEGMHLPAVPTKLLPHLYMGGRRDLSDVSHLRRLGITHILNCAGTSAFSVVECTDNGLRRYAQFHALDNLEYDIMQHFPQAREYINQARVTGGKVFVHCHMGINRSGAICAAYVMAEERLGLLPTVTMIQRKRGLVLMNENFRRQLIQFAKARGLLQPN